VEDLCKLRLDVSGLPPEATPALEFFSPVLEVIYYTFGLLGGNKSFWFHVVPPGRSRSSESCPPFNRSAAWQQAPIPPSLKQYFR